MSKRPVVRWLFIASGIIVLALLLAAIFGGAAGINPKAFLVEPSGPSTGQRFARPAPTCSPGVRCEAHSPATGLTAQATREPH